MTVEQTALFGGYEAEGLDDEQFRMSADRRRTLRQREALANGSHPIGLVLRRHLQLHPEAAPYDDLAADGRRCGNCVFRVLVGWHDRTWPKCTFGSLAGEPLDRSARASHGGATDVRAWWPACVDHQPRGES